MGEHLTYNCKQNLSLITLKIIIFLSCLPTFPHVFLHFMLLLFTYLSVFVCECVVCVCVFTPPPCLHHMVADQIMSNILPLQVFAICSFQMWDLLKAGVIMDMLYPPSFLSHHISLQLMLQREFHVITLALLSRPHERGRGEGDGRTEEGTEGWGWGWEEMKKGEGKQLKLGWDAMTALCCVAMWTLRVS